MSPSIPDAQLEATISRILTRARDQAHNWIVVEREPSTLANQMAPASSPCLLADTSVAAQEIERFGRRAIEEGLQIFGQHYGDSIPSGALAWLRSTMSNFIGEVTRAPNRELHGVSLELKRRLDIDLVPLDRRAKDG